jgi:hypothetical protein
MALMNALPILGEIKQALKELAEGGEPYVIYSNKLPTTLEDRYFLQDVLGKGGWFMYEKVLHTKEVAFNTLIPGVWIEVVFSDRDPKEPILEMVRVDLSPLAFTYPREDYLRGFENFKKDAMSFKDYLKPFAFEVLKAFEEFVGEGKPARLEGEGLENLTYYLVTEGVLVLENKKENYEIVSTNYEGLWLEREKGGKPRALFVGDFPHTLKPTREQLLKAPEILEKRKEHFLPKYQKRVDLPLL